MTATSKIVSGFLLAVFANSTALAQSQQRDAKPVFVIDGDDVTKETIDRLFAPLAKLLKDSPPLVVDVESTCIVVDRLASGEKITSNRSANIRYAVDQAKKSYHFAKVYENDSPTNIPKSPLRLRLDATPAEKAMYAAERKEYFDRLERNPTFHSGAMIRVGDQHYAKKLVNEAAKETSGTMARRVAGFISLLRVPLITAGDALYGFADPRDAFKVYERFPVDRIEVFEDGSHHVIWTLNEKLEREIVFSHDNQMLPVSLEDWVVSKTEDDTKDEPQMKRTRLMSRTLTEWEKAPSGKLRISKAYAKYQGLVEGGTVIVMNLFYDWQKFDPRLDYFTPDSLGFVLPAGATFGSDDVKVKREGGK